MGADERAQHVWAHDGNVQSYHWRFMTSVGRKNVAGFSELPSLMLVTSTPLSTISYWSFLRCFCIFKQQTFELYDDPEVRPSCAINRGKCLRWMATLVFFDHRVMEVTINLQRICAAYDRQLGFVLQCDS